jgi:hypothetical protein
MAHPSPAITATERRGRNLKATLADNELDNLIDTMSALQIGKNKLAFAAHALGIAVHHLKACAD